NKLVVGATDRDHRKKLEILSYIDIGSINTKEALDWGTDHEAEAIEFYENTTGLRIIEAPFIPMKGYEDYAGGSPDGFIEGENGIIEAKCPFISANHIAALIEKNIPKKVYAKYYTQIQFNMMVTETDHCDFISYDPRMIKDEHKIFVQRIPRDVEYIAKIRSRLTAAILEFNKVLSNI
ncbi:hypothetical protein LCGC14_1304840, partial [marine sediment metagenome]